MTKRLKTESKELESYYVYMTIVANGNDSHGWTGWMLPVTKPLPKESQPWTDDQNEIIDILYSDKLFSGMVAEKFGFLHLRWDQLPLNPENWIPWKAGMKQHVFDKNEQAFLDTNPNSLEYVLAVCCKGVWVDKPIVSHEVLFDIRQLFVIEQ